jgi:uncharacterized RDD family membrane protein YckC
MDTNVPPATDLFSDEETVQYEYASTGQRFLNFLVDNLLMRFALSWATTYLVSYILVHLFFDFYVRMVAEQGFRFYFVVYLIAIFNYVIYYTFCEKVFNGYTLGKLITGTRAIQEDGSDLTIGKAFLRSFSRMVPFEAFSGFSGHPWHDTWTHTMVVKARK